MALEARKTLLKTAEERLRAAGLDDARRSAEWLLEETLGLSRIEVISDPERSVSERERDQFLEKVERRAKREPIQYILGHTDFYGMRLRVTPDVLIPRPETEVLVETALESLRDCEAPWVLDVGTGSGAIALAVKKERPDATVFGSDVSRQALDVAAENAEAQDLEVSVVEADALKPSFVERVPACFDLIVSNPPYVPEAERGTLQPEVRDHEPRDALFVDDGDPLVFYRALVGHSEHILRSGGRLLVEAHTDFASQVKTLFIESDLGKVRILPDLSGRPRLVEGRKVDQ